MTLNLVATPTIITEAEARLIRTQQASAAALEGLRAATVDAFRSFWHGNTAEQAALMGSNAREAFARHAATVAYLASVGIAISDEDKIPPVPYRLEPGGSLTLL